MIELIKRGYSFVVSRHGVWALTDQAVLSLGSFLTNILLARMLLPEEYGVFTIIFGLLLFLNGLHNSVVAYPLLVRGALADQVDLRNLTNKALLLTAALAPPLGIGIISGAQAAGVLQLAPWIIGALVCWQLQETVRRALLSHLRYREALWGDALSYLGQAGMFWVVARTGQISLKISFGVMALSSAVAGAVQAFQLGLRPTFPDELWRVVKDFWSLGRWVLLTSLVSIFTVQALPWTLALFHGPEEAAKLQAVGNLLGVTHPIMFSVCNLIIPAAARARLDGGVTAAKQSGFRYATQGLAILLPYYMVLVLYPEGAFGVLYGAGSAYSGLTAELRLYVLVYAFTYLGQILSALLYGLEQSRAAFLGQLASAVASICLGLPLAAKGGLMAALAGAAVSALAQALVCLYYLERKYKS